MGTSLNDVYSRFCSEGKSRLTIYLLLPVSVVTICNTFETNIMVTRVLFIVFLAIIVKFADYGLYNYRRSNSFLAHHIAGGKYIHLPWRISLIKIN